jgi:hypothetical protein
MGGAALLISARGEWVEAGVTAEKIGLLTGAMIAAIVVYGVTAYFLGSEELRLVLGGIGRKLGWSPKK